MIKASVLVEGVEEAYKMKGGYIWGKAGVLWTEAKQREYNKTTDANREQSRLYGSKWYGHMVWDCSGLPYDVLKKHGIKIPHGSNSIWRNSLSVKGKIEKGMKLPVGAAIFTGSSFDSHPHIGTLVTPTCVNEAASTIKGVIHTPLSNRKWTYWGLYKGVEYDFIPGEEIVEANQNGTQTTVVVTDHPLITLHSKKKDAVLEMQNLLLKAGYQLPKFGADGDFGKETLDALKRFQNDHGLKVDGKCGPLTWAELLK